MLLRERAHLGIEETIDTCPVWSLKLIEHDAEIELIDVREEESYAFFVTHVSIVKQEQTCSAGGYVCRHAILVECVDHL